MSEPTPQDITANRSTQTLIIKWSMGESFDIPFSLLRNACPCASCRGGHENMRKEPDEDVFAIPLTNAETTRLASLEAVGGYAIKITWGDGHDAGIYNWHYLYSLCQKMESNNAAGQDD